MQGKLWRASKAGAEVEDQSGVVNYPTSTLRTTKSSH